MNSFKAGIAALLLCLPALPPAHAGEIVAAEYYVDTDPGPGNGVPIPSITPGEEAGLFVDIPASSLAALNPGLHYLTVRFLDAAGNWSVALSRTFEKTAEEPVRPGIIAAAEYYIDQDPGPGNGTALNVPAGSTEVDLSVQVPAARIAELRPGPHLLTVRTRDAWGNWSVALSRLFEKDDHSASPARLAAAIEYRWYRNGNPVTNPITLTAAQAASEIVFEALASVAGLAEGLSYQLVATPVDSLGVRGISETCQITIQITDADGDLMPDAWELTNGVGNPNADDDGDGLSNLAEFSAKTNPKAADTSGDGINDKLAIDLGLDPLLKHPAISTTLAGLKGSTTPTAEQVRALYPGRPVLGRNAVTGKYDLRLGLRESADLRDWRKLAVTPTDTRIENGELIFSFSGPEPTRFYRVDAGE